MRNMSRSLTAPQSVMSHLILPTDAWAEGYKSAPFVSHANPSYGAHASCNPYKFGTYDYLNWSDGYREGRRDLEQQ